MKRREFLKFLSLMSIVGLPKLSGAGVGQGKNNYLVMLELKGGNDSLNTFIPISNPVYYSSRPTIAIAKDGCINISADLGFHPSLAGMANMFEQSDMAIFNNVGYPNPNKSHFTSLAIVEKGVSGGNGWVYEVMKDYDRDLDGIVFSGSVGLFDADVPNFIKIRNIKNFVRQAKWLKIKKWSSNRQVAKYNHTKTLIKQAAGILERRALATKTYIPSNSDSKLAEQFSQIAKVIKSNTNMPILKLHLPGFDTHADQLTIQSELLLDLNDSLQEFRAYLKGEGLWDNTLIYAFSEFGRRIRENGNGGTDHGEGYTGFALGGRVSGGIYGGVTDLSGENIKFKLDHRQLLHTLEDKWVKSGKITRSVNGFSKVDFIKG